MKGDVYKRKRMRARLSEMGPQMQTNVHKCKIKEFQPLLCTPLDLIGGSRIDRRQAEYGFGEHGFKHQAQWIFWPSPSSRDRVQWVPLCFFCFQSCFLTPIPSLFPFHSLAVAGVKKEPLAQGAAAGDFGTLGVTNGLLWRECANNFHHPFQNHYTHEIIVFGDCSHSFQGSSELISITVTVSLFSCRMELQETIALRNFQEFSSITVTWFNGVRI